MPRKHIPNLLTSLRLLLAFVFFGLLAIVDAGDGRQILLLDVAFAIFLVAVTTDFLDGYLARKWDVVTVFGRIADPFADKIIIVGAFVLLIPLQGAVLKAWMVVVILAREFLISAIRGFAESQGISFAATMAGKLKFWSQCFAVGALLLLLGRGREIAWFEQATVLLVWVAVAATVASGLSYLLRARQLFGLAASPADGGSAAPLEDGARSRSLEGQRPQSGALPGESR